MICHRYSKFHIVADVKQGLYNFSYCDGIGWISRWFTSTQDGFDWLNDKLPDLSLEETLQLIKIKNDNFC